MLATIVGHAGYIGSHLAQLLAGRGDDVFLPERNDPRLFGQKLGTVFYCAGLTADFRARPFDTVEAHVTLLARLLKEADFERLIYLSSTRLYDSLGGIRASEDLALRLNPDNPRHLYDFSKGLGENLCVTTSAGKASVARLSCIFGGSGCRDGFIAELIAKTLGHQEITLESSPHFTRDYLHVDEAAQLILAIAERGSHPIYNVARGENTPNSQLFEIVSRLTGCAIKTTSTAHVDAPTIDVTRIREEFGFSATPIEHHLAQDIATLRRTTLCF